MSFQVHSFAFPVTMLCKILVPFQPKVDAFARFEVHDRVLLFATTAAGLQLKSGYHESQNVGHRHRMEKKRNHPCSAIRVRTTFFFA